MRAAPLLLVALCGAPAAAQAPTPKAAAPAAAADQAIVGADHTVVRDGLRIHLWQKCLTGGEAAAAKADKVAILVHGATWSGQPDFDLQIGDYSLMDAMARAGYDVWAIDIHGYGKSDKTDKDWSDTASAALDLDAAVEHVCALRQVAQVKLLGWSWGAMITGVYATAHPRRVARLILYGAAWKGTQWQHGRVPDTQYRPTSSKANTNRVSSMPTSRRRSPRIRAHPMARSSTSSPRCRCSTPRRSTCRRWCCDRRRTSPPRSTRWSSSSAS
jgi:pimeloyl-ACP methyl ester carboxylesterase